MVVVFTEVVLTITSNHLSFKQAGCVMKFDRIIEQYGTTYAVFNTETSNEREFFKNICGYILKAPIDVSKYLLNSSVPPILGWDSDRIDILVGSKYNFTVLDSSSSKLGIYHFLTDLYEKKVLSENLYEQVENAVIKYNAVKV